MTAAAPDHGPARWADLLRHHRAARGFSESELSDRCGVSRHVYASWERGEAWPDGRQTQKLYASVAALRAHAGLLVAEKQTHRGPVLRMAGAASPSDAPPSSAPSAVQDGPVDEPTPAASRPAPTLPPAAPARGRLTSAEVGLRLRAAREREGLSAQALAEILAVDTSTVLRYERGERALSPDRLAQTLALFPDLLAVAPPRAARAPRRSAAPPSPPAAPATTQTHHAPPLWALPILLAAEPGPSADDRAWAAERGRGQRAAERRWAARILRCAETLDRAAKKSSLPPGA